MNKKTLVFLVGETGSGKDTVANKLPYKKICSYTTREMRKGIETPGVNHHFVSDEFMDELEDRTDLVAWTKTGDIRYCATEEQLEDGINVYIIDPDGVRWFNENYEGPALNIIVIGLYLPLAVRRQRCKNRPDFKTSFKKRVEAEEEDFNKFRLYGEFDYMIRNDNSEKTASIVDDIIKKHIVYIDHKFSNRGE